MNKNENEIVNAVITDIEISMERGPLSFGIFFEFNQTNEGCGETIGLGWIPLNNKGIIFLTRLMETLEVLNWSSLKGKYVRLKLTGVAAGTTISSLGHILKNNWIDLKILS